MINEYLYYEQKLRTYVDGWPSPLHGAWSTEREFWNDHRELPADLLTAARAKGLRPISTTYSGLVRRMRTARTADRRWKADPVRQAAAQADMREVRNRAARAAQVEASGDDSEWLADLAERGGVAQIGRDHSVAYIDATLAERGGR